MDRIAEYLTPREAADRILQTAREMDTEEVVAVRNLGFVPHDAEIYFLVPQSPLPLKDISAFAVDMDGTSTTTEPLALHALEFMVRRITGRISHEEWPGLDHEKDIPFVIGNSNFRHTEFLLKRYTDAVSFAAFRDSFIEALLWTWANMDDRQRRDDVKINAVNCGLAPLLDDAKFRECAHAGPLSDKECSEKAAAFIESYGDLFHPKHFTAEVSAAMDIYYHRYHSILRQMEQGQADEIAHTLLDDPEAHLVAPMPGYGIFLCLLKGWLTDEAKELAAVLRSLHPVDTQPKASDADIFLELARHFRKHPAKVALVTASIAYEAHVVMKEVIRLVREEVSHWSIPGSLQDELRNNLVDYQSIYQGFVTASDAWEARLKPHRDLYSIAMHEMSVPQNEYPQCIAIEDTEPGILSARAAGFGVSIALPNYDTNRQNYEKASAVLHGGLPELVLDKKLLLEI
jgi:beta-phosphoglucomutase-like phosphatase (HAD superfamily)